VPVFASIDDFLPLLLVGIAIAITVVLWRMRARMVRRMARRRAAGYQLWIA